MKTTIFILTILAQLSLQACDSTTCEFCCVTIPPATEAICADNIINCKLNNKHNFTAVLVLIGIVAFWCCFTPICLKSCKFTLTSQFCFGYTIFGALEKALKSVVKKKKNNRIGTREHKSVRENIKTLRNHFQKRKFKEGEERRKRKFKEKGFGESGVGQSLMNKQSYYWKKDDLLAK